MHSHPFTLLLSSSTWIVAISRYSIHVFDPRSGRSTSSVEQNATIIAAALDGEAKHLIAIDENKQLRVWDISVSGELRLARTRTLNKKPSCLALDEDYDGKEPFVLVGDRFGDVFRHVLYPQKDVKLRPFVRFPLNPPPETQQPSAGISAETTEKKDKDKDASDGTLLLGHVSILTCLLLSGPRGSPKRCVITADRDEHIRISRYPQSFVVEGWCLGSKSFINALHILPSPSPPSESGPQLLLSGGGEDVIRIWDWRTGKCLGSVEIRKIVQPFLRIKRSKWRQETENDGGDGEEMQDIEMAEVGVEETEHALAVQKIVSIRAGSTTRIIFSVIGASALFTFEMLSNTSEHFSSLEVSASPDLGESILDFTCVECEIYVSVDGGEKQGDTIRLLRLEGSKLSHIPELDSAAAKGLNASVAASADPIPDYYQLLDLLPKSPSQPVVIQQPAPNAAGGRKGVKKAAREGLRRALSEKSKTGEEAESPGPEPKKSRVETS